MAAYLATAHAPQVAAWIHLPGGRSVHALIHPAPGSSTLPAHAGNTSFCEQTMTCICPLCQAEREQRVAQGVHRSKRQPWATRTAA